MVSVSGRYKNQLSVAQNLANFLATNRSIYFDSLYGFDIFDIFNIFNVLLALIFYFDLQQKSNMESNALAHFKKLNS